MRKLLALVILSLVIVMPVLAQDATPEATQTPPVTIINEQSPAAPAIVQAFDIAAVAPYLIVIGVLGLLLVLVVTDNRKMAQQLADALSPSSFEILAAAANKGINLLGGAVAATPSQIDDSIFLEVKDRWADLETRVRGLEAAKTATPAPTIQVNNNVPSEGGN